jgi:hypothetical protein
MSYRPDFEADSLLDADAVQVGVPHDVLVGELLGLCDEFFRTHASGQTRAELQRFLAARGYTTADALGWFIDMLCFTATPSRSCEAP